MERHNGDYARAPTRIVGVSKGSMCPLSETHLMYKTASLLCRYHLLQIRFHQQHKYTAARQYDIATVQYISNIILVLVSPS